MKPFNFPFPVIFIAFIDYEFSLKAGNVYRPTLVVLGLIQEASVQRQVAQNQAVEPTVSAEATVETTTQEATSPS